MIDPTLSSGDSMRLELIVSVPWDTGGMPEIFIPSLRTSMVTAKAPTFIRVPVRIRVNPWRRLDVLASDPFYTHGAPAVFFRFSALGEALGTVIVEPPKRHQRGWQILDFVSDASDNLYLLETCQDDAGDQHHLRKIAPEGTVLWARSGPVTDATLDLDTLTGTFRQLFVDEQSTPYLAATQPRGLVGRIDPQNGTLHAFADWGLWSGEILMDGLANIYHVRYLPETRQRCWVSYDPYTRSEQVTPCDDSLYGFLGRPIGVDARGQAYGVIWTSIACVTPMGTLGWQERMDNLVFDPIRALVYLSTFDATDEAAAIQVRAWSETGRLEHAIRLTLPPHLLTEHAGGWSLIQIDAAGRHVVYGGETSSHAGTLLIYTPHGDIEQEKALVPDIHTIAYRLQPGATWSVDPLGSVYLPVTGPTGFHIIRLTHD